MDCLLSPCCDVPLRGTIINAHHCTAVRRIKCGEGGLMENRRQRRSDRRTVRKEDIRNAHSRLARKQPVCGRSCIHIYFRTMMCKRMCARVGVFTRHRTVAERSLSPTRYIGHDARSRICHKLPTSPGHTYTSGIHRYAARKYRGFSQKQRNWYAYARCYALARHVFREMERNIKITDPGGDPRSNIRKVRAASVEVLADGRISRYGIGDARVSNRMFWVSGTII